jgi:hypothetical protein
LICGNWRSKDENGRKHQWLLEPPKKPPLLSITPTTTYFQPFNSTVLLSGLSRGKRTLRSSSPITQTAAACSMSASVMKRPSLTKCMLASM